MKSDSRLRRAETGREPFFPLHARLVDQAVELGGQRAAGDGDGEPALLLNGFLLCLYDEMCEPVAELDGGRERVEDRGRGGAGGHGGDAVAKRVGGYGEASGTRWE